MKKLFSLLTAFMLLSVVAHADVAQEITNLKGLFDQHVIPYVVVDTFDRANSQVGKVQFPEGSYNGIVTLTFSSTLYSPAYFYDGYPWDHTATNGVIYPSASGGWTGGGVYWMLHNAFTGEVIMLGKKANGDYKKIQIKSDGSAILFFDQNGYSYKCTLQYSVQPDKVTFFILVPLAN